MDPLKQYQAALQDAFPSLALFSDIDWSSISKEYLVSYDERPAVDDYVHNFPSYLQSKAEDGDCPPYLFELAYFELAQRSLEDFSIDEFPTSPGIHLNPSLLFLEFEFDVVRMLKNSSPGNPQVFEKPMVLCLYKDLAGGISLMELNKESLELLEYFEDAPRPDDHFVSTSSRDLYNLLCESDLILRIDQ